MSLISFAGVCAGAVLVFLGAASSTMTGEFGVREAYAIFFGGVIILASMYNRFNTLCEKAGIGPRPFHALRATCVKFCQAAGWSPEQVAELTGDTIEVIQAHYATPSQAEMAETMKNKEVC